MLVREYVCVALCALLHCVCAGAPRDVDAEVIEYPEARRNESVVDDYHGTKIKDPYRWLEDPYSEETKQFIEAQNNITRPYIDSYPDKEKFQERIKDILDFPKYLPPFRRGDHYFFFLKDGLQSQRVLYMQDSLYGAPRVFLDPNKLSEDGTVALNDYAFSDDGTLFAYALSASGSDWVEIHFKNVNTGEDYPDVLKKVKFSGLAWTDDNKGIFYSGFLGQQGKTDGSETEMNKYQKLYYHHLGTPQSEDVLIAEFPNEPLWRMIAEVTTNGRYMLMNVYKDHRYNLVYFADLSQHENITGPLPLKQIVTTFDAEYTYVATEGSVCIFRTNKDAANYRLIAIDLDNPEEKNWKTIVQEHPSDVLMSAFAVDNDKLVLHYTRDVKSVLQLNDLATGQFLQDFDLDVGTVHGSGKKNQTEMFFYFSSYLTPGIIYHVDFTSPAPYKPKVFREINLKGYNASLYESQQVFYSSKDGTKVPMFISYRKDLPRDGSSPALLYGYGGFSISLGPEFSILWLMFMQHFQGVVAVANIRGGGEYGQRWYDGGRLLKKQNVFDDFHAAAEYLVAEKYTSPELLTIQGGSNGGLLVAACINQRPELYGAAIAEIGVLDMLRFQKFTIGYAWTSDYGNSDNKTHFENLIKYSPLHNIRPPSEERAQYPATLVLTADHDDRVVPLHSLKFVAELQHAVRGSSQTLPLLARIDTKAGHGGGQPTAKIIDHDTDVLSFIGKALKLRFVN